MGSEDSKVRSCQWGITSYQSPHHITAPQEFQFSRNLTTYLALLIIKPENFSPLLRAPSSLISIPSNNLRNAQFSIDLIFNCLYNVPDLTILGNRNTARKDKLRWSGKWVSQIINTMKSKDSVRYFSFIGYNYMFWLADIFSQPQVSTRVQVYNMYKWVLILLVMKMCFANYIYILLAHFHSILLLCSSSSCLFPYSDIWALPNDTMTLKFTRHGKLLPYWIPVVGLKEEQDLQMCTELWSFLYFCELYPVWGVIIWDENLTAKVVLFFHPADSC